MLFRSRLGLPLLVLYGVGIPVGAGIYVLIGAVAGHAGHAAPWAFALAAALLAGANFAQAAIPVYGFVVKNTYPHDPQAFTQGLFIKDGQLFESTGQKGQSSLRRVDLKTGKVLQKKELADEYFGEGSTLVGDTIVNLTWQSNVGFIYDAKTFALKGRFNYKGEGWGLASDANNVYMSDGSAEIRILDPKTLEERRRIRVTAEGKQIGRAHV